MHEPVCDSIDLTYHSEPRRELVARRPLRSHPASADNQNDLIVCAEPTGRGVAGEALTVDGFDLGGCWGLVDRHGCCTG